MARRGRRLPFSFLLLTTLPFAFLGCKQEDPQVRALTVKAAQADEAAQQLRQAWSEQFRRLSLAGVKGLRAEVPMLLTPEQKQLLEARVRIEKDSSRRALLQEILAKEVELRALDAGLLDLRASLPPPEIARVNDSHYGLALHFLKGQGQTGQQARQALSRVALSDRLAPGFEVYHFYVHGEYGTWVSQGSASLSPKDLALRDPDLDLGPLANERNEALALSRRLQRELSLLEGQRRGIEGEIAVIQTERTRILEGRAHLQSENTQQLATLNSLHYLINVREVLEREGIIEIPLFGKDQSGPNWRDAVFTHHLDLRSSHSLLIRAQDLGLRRIGKVSVVPGSYRQDEHYRLTLGADGQTAMVELLALPRFKNDKVVFAVVE